MAPKLVVQRASLPVVYESAHRDGAYTLMGALRHGIGRLLREPVGTAAAGGGVVEIALSLHRALVPEFTAAARQAGATLHNGGILQMPHGALEAIAAHEDGDAPPVSRSVLAVLRRLQRTAAGARAAWAVEAGTDLPAMLLAVLGAVNEEFLGTNHVHRDWILSLGHRTLAALGDTVRLVVPRYLDNPEGRAAVALYATIRHPVHMPSTIIAPGLPAVLGYSTEDADELEASCVMTAPVRFAVVGKAAARYGRTPDGGPNYLWVVHAWGVHLGDGYITPRPADLRFVDETPDQDERVARCEELMRVNAALIRRALRYVLDTDPGARRRGVLLMWSGLGKGAWLDSDVVHDAQKLAGHWTRLAREAARSFNRGGKDRVLVWEPFLGEWTPSHTDAYLGDADDLVWENITNNADPCGGFIVPDVDDAYVCGTDGSQRFRPGNRVVVLVNAWDDWSFIGNGGMQDNTLDGWTVVGGGHGSKSAVGRNPHPDPSTTDPVYAGESVCWQAASTAYMHNVFFCPQALTDPGRTLVADDAGATSPAFDGRVRAVLETFRRADAAAAN